MRFDLRTLNIFIMADIFISYKREDKSKAALLADKLETSGWTVWWDHDLLGGEDFDTAIERELRSAKCVIVVWSALSIQSRFVKDEAKNALNRNLLVPVSFDHTEPPIGFGMTHVIFFENSNRISEKEYLKLHESVANKMQAEFYQPPIAKRSVLKKYVYSIAGLIIIAGLIFIFNPFKKAANNKTIISSATENDTMPGSQPTTDNTNNANSSQSTQSFEEKIVLLVNDCGAFFEKSKKESLGFKKFARTLDCIAFTSTIRLSEFTEDTIFNCSASGRTWVYITNIAKGVDSIAMSEKFKEYKIKTEFALPDYKDVYATTSVKGKIANYTDGKTSVMLSMDKNLNQNFIIQLWVGPQ